MEARNEFEVALPHYLTHAQREALLADLRAFPATHNYYMRSGRPEELLQGDGWKGFVVIRFEDGERKPVSGVIISNSCDIDVNNRRDLNRNILFAPIVSMSKLTEVIRSVKGQEADVQEKLAAIRRQEIFSMFYLPAFGESSEEAVILLDDIHSHPVEHFMGTDRQRLFRLSQTGFYLFLFKLSLHFTRMGEGVARFEEADGS